MKEAVVQCMEMGLDSPETLQGPPKLEWLGPNADKTGYESWILVGDQGDGQHRWPIELEREMPLMKTCKWSKAVLERGRMKLGGRTSWGGPTHSNEASRPSFRI